MEAALHWEERRHASHARYVNRFSNVVFTGMLTPAEAGRFTTQNKVQVMAIPIVIKSSDLESPTPVIIFTAPDKPLEDSESGWPHEVAFGKNMFRLVHEATSELFKFLLFTHCSSILTGLNSHSGCEQRPGQGSSCWS
jgi:hypothetical protein